MRNAALLSAILAATIPLNVLAATRTIGDLTDGALIGPIASTAQLQTAMRDREPLIAQAGSDLGLSAADVAEVQAKIARGQAQYVHIPRHLDGMAGEHGGVAFAVHDVNIPANVYGWEVDLNKPNELVRVFIPNQCGNISYLRVPQRRVAAVRPYHFVAHGMSYKPAPQPTAAPLIAAAPFIAPTPVPAATAAPVVAMTADAPHPAAMVAAAAIPRRSSRRHRHRFLHRHRSQAARLR
jgi:hypothetical protein